ncbi:MAG: hypothetical protein B1H13_13760, partial [Desulfobacteraceae bacterium 4484_190.3]
AIFHDLNAAGDAVTEVTTSGIRLAGCEIMDKFSLKVVEEALGKDVSKSGCPGYAADQGNMPEIQRGGI